MSAHVIAAGGAVVFWTGGPTSRQILDARLEQLGLQDFTPLPRTDAQSLKIALGDYADQQKQSLRRATKRGAGIKRDKLVQPHRNQKQNGFEVVDVSRGDAANDYVTDFSAKVTDGVVQISRGYAEIGDLQDKGTVDLTAGRCVVGWGPWLRGRRIFGLLATSRWGVACKFFAQRRPDFDLASVVLRSQFLLLF